MNYYENSDNQENSNSRTPKIFVISSADPKFGNIFDILSNVIKSLIFFASRLNYQNLAKHLDSCVISNILIKYHCTIFTIPTLKC